MDIRQTLRYLGAPIGAKSFLFGDNRSVVTSATLPHSTLTKRHNILAFHRVREAIPARLMAFYWIQPAYSLSDIDRIPSTTPGAEPPRDARDSGSARSHSTHLETSSSNRP